MRLAELMRPGALTGAARNGNPATVATVATVEAETGAECSKVASVARLPHDLTPADAHSRFRLPDARELWVSPPETLEQIRARCPGAVPWADACAVTVPELAPEDEAVIRAWLVSLGETSAAIEQDIRTARRFPDTAAWLLARARIDVTARAILHTCGECQHFTHDPEAGGGVGTCAITKAGHPPNDASGYPLCYPCAQRRCSNFEAARDCTVTRAN